MNLEDFINQALAQSAKEIADVQKGKLKALQAIVGKLMALTKGQADPIKSIAIIRQKLGLPEEVKEKKIQQVTSVDHTPFSVISSTGPSGTVYKYGEELTFSLIDVINDDERIPVHLKKYIMNQLVITDTTEEEMLARRRQRENS